MSSLLDMLSQTLKGSNLTQISQEVGEDEAKTENAIQSALPALIGALTKNGASEDGAKSILGALDKEGHDEGVMDNLSEFIGQKKYEDPKSGPGILGHLFGGKQEGVQQAVSKSSGISGAGSAKLMQMLAPMVMGALGKQKKEQGFDASSLMGFLGGEKSSLGSQASGMLGFLDQDGDGDVDMSDLTKGVGKLFGGS